MEKINSHIKVDTEGSFSNYEAASFAFDLSDFEDRMSERLAKIRNQTQPENLEARPAMVKENYRS